MQLQLWPSLAIWLRGSGSLVSENFPQTNGKGMELFVSWWAPLGEHHIPCLWCQPVMWFSGQREEPEEEAPARGSVRDSPQTDLKLVASKRIHQDSKMWPCTPFRPQTSSSAKQPQWPWDALWFQHVHSNSNYRPQDAPKEETRGACRNIGRNYSPLIFLPHFWLVKPFVPLGVALIWAEGHELEGCYFVLPFSSIFLFVRLVNEFRILVMLLFFDIVWTVETCAELSHAVFLHIAMFNLVATCAGWRGLWWRGEGLRFTAVTSLDATRPPAWPTAKYPGRWTEEEEEKTFGATKRERGRERFRLWDVKDWKHTMQLQVFFSISLRFTSKMRWQWAVKKSD